MLDKRAKESKTRRTLRHSKGANPSQHTATSCAGTSVLEAPQPMMKCYLLQMLLRMIAQTAASVNAEMSYGWMSCAGWVGLLRFGVEHRWKEKTF